MCQTVPNNDARDSFLKKADNIDVSDNSCFSVMQRSRSDADAPSTRSDE